VTGLHHNNPKKEDRNGNLARQAKAIAENGEYLWLCAKGPSMNAQLVVSDTLKFIVAIGFLLLLVTLGWLRDDSQYNMLFLTLLALACSMVFVYLPFTAELNVGWFKAGSAAAIFGVVMWITVPFAQDLKKANYKTALDAQNTIIEDLKKQLNQVELQRNAALQAKTAGDACATKTDSLKQYVASVKTGTDQLKGSLTQVQQWLEAAKGNSSDAATCSLRASQGLGELAKSFATLNGISTAIGSATAISQ
jgi:hypothetical protein